MVRGAAGLKPQRPPTVGNINKQKSWVEIGGSGYKSMAKIATLHDNNSYITPPLGSPVWGQYSIGLGYCVLGCLPYQVPRGPRDGGAHISGVRNLLLHVTRSEEKPIGSITVHKYIPQNRLSSTYKKLNLQNHRD